MTAWTRDIVLCTDGAAGYSPRSSRQLARNGIALIEKRIARLEGARGRLRAVEFRDGGAAGARRAVLRHAHRAGNRGWPNRWVASFGRDGGVFCGEYEATSVPGVFVAGNIIRDVQLSIVAAAEGARAAFGINRALTREDFERAGR